MKKMKCCKPLSHKTVLAAPLPITGSAIASWRLPKSCLDQVFNNKLGCFDITHVMKSADVYPHLELNSKTRFWFHLASL